MPASSHRVWDRPHLLHLLSPRLQTSPFRYLREDAYNQAGVSSEDNTDPEE